jgi:hypothetical protein
MLALSVGLTVLSLWLLVLNHSHPDVPVYHYWTEGTLLAVVYSTVGALAASHRPANPVGWVLCSIGLSWGVIHFTGEYATYALLTAPGVLPGAEAAAWIYSWVWVSSCSYPCCFPVVVCLLLAGVHSRGSASCWW